MLVVAGPGSGKTRTLTSRIAYLSARSQEPIIGVTFTRDAAEEIRRRVTQLVGRSTKHLRVGTFHSLCMEQLRLGGRLGRLLSPAEQRNLLRRAWSTCRTRVEWDDAAKIIEHFKSDIDPRAPDDPSGWLFNAYEALLREHGAMDFSDLLLSAVRGMRQGVLSPLPCRHMLVDEYQDTDAVQMEWVRLHALAGADVCIVGDDDQSIYGWRHAQGYRGMVRFETEFKATRVSIGINYRCGSAILSAADRLIRHNSHERLAKNLQAGTSYRGSVQYRSFTDRHTEAVAFVQLAKTDPDNWACLARTNRLLDIVEAQLTANRVPYYRVGSGRLWERPHIGAYIATLRALVTDETLGYEQMLAHCGVDEETIGQFRPLTPERLHDIPSAMIESERERFIQLAQFVRTWRENCEQERWELAIHGAAAWYASQSAKGTEQEDYEIVARALCDMTGTMSARLARLTYSSARRGRKGVALLSIHAAKGLEFEHVQIIGLEERILPHEDSDVAEERRLCYVGMTRAKQTLIMSRGRETTLPSRFLSEAGLATMLLDSTEKGAVAAGAA